jgi:hypothetical protein
MHDRTEQRSGIAPTCEADRTDHRERVRTDHRKKDRTDTRQQIAPTKDAIAPTSVSAIAPGKD